MMCFEMARVDVYHATGKSRGQCRLLKSQVENEF
jgi:hypothetical protein